MKKKLTYFILTAIALLLVYNLITGKLYEGVQKAFSGDLNITDLDVMVEHNYTDMLELIKQHPDCTIYFSSSEEYMYVKFADGTYAKSLCPHTDEWRADMIEQGYNVKKDKTVTSTNIAGTFWLFAPQLMLLAFFIYSVRQLPMFKKEESFRKETTTKFSDVIGHDEIIEDVKFIVTLLKDPSAITKIGGRTPKGMLFQGPPGTGKTLLARALAGEAEVPFLYCSASRFKELYVGNGARHVRALFAEAKKVAPCIVFIDEIDAIGGKRDHAIGNEESTQTIDELLTQLDGFEGNEGVFVIAATNSVHKLDSALTRAGRFDRKVTINPPKDYGVRKKLFEHYFRNVKLMDDVDLDSVSKQTVGFTGADIEAVCNESVVLALQNGCDKVDNDFIEEAIDKQTFEGNRSKAEVAEEDQRRVARHEAGHAVATLLFGESVARASVQPTTSGVGGAVFGEDKLTSLHTKSYYENRIKICYAGHVAEYIFYAGDVSVGASNDIQKATDMIAEYLGNYGFDPDFGPICVETFGGIEYVKSSEEFVEQVQKTAKRLYSDILDLMTTNKELLDVVATELKKRETLSGAELNEIMADYKAA